MGMVQKFWNFVHSEQRSVERMESQIQEVKHDLTNIRARVDVISRMVGKMREDTFGNGNAIK